MTVKDEISHTHQDSNVCLKHVATTKHCCLALHMALLRLSNVWKSIWSETQSQHRLIRQPGTNQTPNGICKLAPVSYLVLVQKPTPNELPALVAPVAEHMQAATALIEGRRSAVFNHQKAVAESLHALSWMVYTGPNCGMVHSLTVLMTYTQH